MYERKVAIYARISTNETRQDVENQLEPLRAWAKRIGGVVVKEFVDHDSGSKTNRPQLINMMTASHRREFDVVLIWSLDRLSRSGISHLTGYLEQLKKSGVMVLSHQESWLDNTSPMVSDLLLAIFGWVAQQERERIRERVKAGLDRAKSKGRKLGRPERKFDVSKAFSLKEAGHSIRKIAQILRVPKSTISRALSQKPIENPA